MAQTMVGAMDPYWGSLHCVCTLKVPPYRDVYIDYVIESATYRFLFTSCKTLENERVSAANE